MLTLARMIVTAMGLAPPGDDQAADKFIEFVEDRNINDRRWVPVCRARHRVTRCAQVCGGSFPLVGNGVESIHVLRSRTHLDY